MTKQELETRLAQEQKEHLDQMAKEVISDLTERLININVDIAKLIKTESFEKAAIQRDLKQKVITDASIYLSFLNGTKEASFFKQEIDIIDEQILKEIME